MKKIGIYLSIVVASGVGILAVLIGQRMDQSTVCTVAGAAVMGLVTIPIIIIMLVTNLFLVREIRKTNEAREFSQASSSFTSQQRYDPPQQIMIPQPQGPWGNFPEPEIDMTVGKSRGGGRQKIMGEW